MRSSLMHARRPSRTTGSDSKGGTGVVRIRCIPKICFAGCREDETGTGLLARGYDGRGTPKQDIQLAIAFTRSRNGLRPSGVAINACQQEGEGIRWWKTSNPDRYGRAGNLSTVGAKRLYGAHVCLPGHCIVGMECKHRNYLAMSLHGRPDGSGLVDEALCGTEYLLDGRDYGGESEILQSEVPLGTYKPYFSLLTSQKISRVFSILKVLI
ncbi:hypothetical protein TNIN_126791 [Trichonephila inaurata madagascariensis]|uniref:Uncharacterized protein n=1 Tax=Trichonephila inaurata madagascariensis TaxID=2747483 RepID=A0A8X7CIY2_9ARAC|nr:hypothetical protein TNIN_126771 [Trichonephila inaurata madagascariensis]GFY68888.1 hypothetical protein TNIN_126791 [Trichonephila inaurata madagascariensis]